MQYDELKENLPLLGDKEIKMIQIIVGTFIYYGIAIHNTILVTLNDIVLWITEKIRDHHRLGSQNIHRHHFKMGLRQPYSSAINAKICPKGTRTHRPYFQWETRALPRRSHPHQLRQQDTIRRTR